MSMFVVPFFLASQLKSTSAGDILSYVFLRHKKKNTWTGRQGGGVLLSGLPLTMGMSKSGVASLCFLHTSFIFLIENSSSQFDLQSHNIGPFFYLNSASAGT